MMRDFTKILRYIKPFKLQACLNIIFNIFVSIFGLFSLVTAIPFLGILFDSQKLVYDKVPFSILNIDSFYHNFNYYLSYIIINEGKEVALFYIGMIVIIFTLLKVAFWYLANHFMVPLRNGVVQNIRNEMYKKIVYLPLGYFTEERKGNIISRMSNDVKEIEWGIMSSLEMIFRDPLRILIYLGTMVYLDWRLTIFAIILFPIVGLIVGASGKKLRGTALTGQQQIGTLLAQIEEMIGGLRIIKAFNAEDKCYNRFKKQNRDYTRTSNKISRLQFLASPLTEFLATISVVIIMMFGGKLIINDAGTTLTPAQLIGFLVIFSQIIVPGKAITTAWYNIKKGMASVDRVSEILNAKNLISESQGNKTIEKFHDKIEFKNVFFSYSGQMVLSDINLTIKYGQKIALVGQSGSGKTTLADLIPRFYDVISGELLFDGHNIKDYTIVSIRNQIGYVSQNPILFNDSIYNNIALGKDGATRDEIIAAAKIANAHDFIMASDNGYETNIGDGGSRLSGGQKQRLSIARAILKNPSILIFDEATSSLDTESELLVQNALDTLMCGKTAIIIAHRLSTIKNVDTICVVDKARIIEMGSHNELIEKKGAYYDLYKIQNQ